MTLNRNVYQTLELYFERRRENKQFTLESRRSIEAYLWLNWFDLLIVFVACDGARIISTNVSTMPNIVYASKFQFFRTLTNNDNISAIDLFKGKKLSIVPLRCVNILNNKPSNKKN